ncbi:MAG: winged helix-turn-helix domain-containing protein [Syntrophus sp. (in: bacteria)]
MDLESVKRFVLLTSVLDLNGKGTKQKVLDNIERKQYYKISREEQQTMESRDEERWRNDFAFIRSHLVKKKYLDNSKHDNWEITQRGRIYFQSLLQEVLRSRNHDKLANVTIIRAKELSEKVNEMSLTSKDFVGK